VKNHEPGTVEAMKPMNSKTTVETHYIKIELAGETLCEVDKYGYKCVIDGVDLLAEVRANIGM
jgi:phage tail tube protein FII